MHSNGAEPVRLDGMVVVASGASPAILRWSDALRIACISFAVVRCHYDAESAPLDHSEIWVEKADVEKARAIFRS